MKARAPLRPRFGRALPFALVALALAIAFPLASGAPAAGTAQLAPSTGVLRICSGCSSYGLSDGSRYGYAILHTWDYGKIPQLKAANPGIKVLLYKDVAATVDYTCRNGSDDRMLPTGVGYCWASASHPDWFLRDASGNRISFCDYPHDWLMDVGSPEYEQAWLQNAVSDAKRYGFDGVMLDDVDEWMDNHMCGRTIAKYPTHASWAAATTRFMAAVGPGLTSQGLLVFPNVAIADYWTSAGLSYWDTWLSYSSGAVQEYYTKWSGSSSSWFTGLDWSSRQDYLRHTQAAGKVFIGITYAPKSDAHSQRYARGSFLLDWDGRSSSLVYQPTDPEAQDPYSSIWTTSLGPPIGTRYQVGVAWRRDYTGGTVIVNPSTGPVSVSLGGTFSMPDGTLRSSVTVPAADAALLVKASSGAPPPSGAALPASTSVPRSGRAD
jgi:hypothetical protein